MKKVKHNILVAVDGSQNALKALQYVGSVLGKDARVTLYHVLPKAPVKGIEKEEILMGHHLVFKENVEDFRAWLASRREAMEKVMDDAKRQLAKSGITQKNIKVKIEKYRKGVARDILNELKQGKYDTVVVGRRGLSGTKAFFSGSVSSKIIHHAKNCAVWVVE